MDERDASHRGGVMVRSGKGLRDRWRDRKPNRSEQFGRRLGIYGTHHDFVQQARSKLLSTS